MYKFSFFVLFLSFSIITFSQNSDLKNSKKENFFTKIFKKKKKIVRDSLAKEASLIPNIYLDSLEIVEKKDTVIGDSEPKEEEEEEFVIVSEHEMQNKTDSILNFQKTYFSEQKIYHYIHLSKDELPHLTDEIIALKLEKIPTSINLRSIPEIGKQIRSYIYNHRDFIVKMLTKAEYYFPIFEIEFDKQNMPLELKYISVIESHLNPKAKSPVGATGLWQFMYATAKYKGMDITSLEDPRKNPHISTQYAADYLQQLYSIYDDWLLAISAYNAGPGNINKAIRSAGGVKNYWVARPFMPRETQQYVPKIIAVMYAMYYAQEYSLFPRAPETDYLNMTQVKFFEKLSLKYAAELLGMDRERLSELNPMLTKEIIPQRVDGYVINIPKNRLSNYEYNRGLFYDDPYLKNETLAQEEKSVKDYNGSGTYSTYTIRSGDNLGYIAELYNCRVSDIKRWNGLSSSSLRIGKKLRMYTSYKPSISSPKIVSPTNQKVGFNKAELASCNCNFHTIVSGDNLWDISSKYNCSIEQLKSINSIPNKWSLRIGTCLKLPY